ncbi:unnamed protein product [Owenia fusiformis]|uniref:Uncharacterized protein n=1 Tax=Owenia fusiformis TaxID=6347 RepID=A0A8J1UT64_OWEFU|nr:unnamed protein product [Owenia fusiformis]
MSPMILYFSTFVWSMYITTALNITQICHPKFAVLDGHSACSLPSSELIDAGVSAEDRKMIVTFHNKYRREVSPPATNMQVIVWDEEIAMIAQHWAATCPSPERPLDENHLRGIPGRFNRLGQNAAFGQASWSAVVAEWHEEQNFFIYGKPPKGNKRVGHYTQVVWASSGKVGCGYAECSGSRKIYICNYALVGNVAKWNDPGTRFKPYETGTPCTACPSRCNDGLCDCKGKVCHNGGILNPETCTCTCPKLYHTGDLCDVDCKLATDSFGCASQNGSVWTEEGCKTIGNAGDECPLQCQSCPAGGINFDIDLYLQSVEHGRARISHGGNETSRASFMGHSRTTLVGNLNFIILVLVAIFLMVNLF